jgi:hypothetical protein
VSEGDGARGYLVECYWPGVAEQEVAEAARRAVQAAAEIRRPGHGVDFLTAILVPADDTAGTAGNVRAGSRLPEMCWLRGRPAALDWDGVGQGPGRGRRTAAAAIPRTDSQLAAWRSVRVIGAGLMARSVR